jgi:outer membrane protein assembly factor BamE (lipoprotein component of BamABCDE complex)
MIRNIHAFAITSIVVLLSACSGPQLKWSDAGKIKSGMSTEEVTHIMGEPNVVASRDGKLFYTWASRGICKGSRAVTIEFKENKVTDAPAVPSTFKD